MKEEYNQEKRRGSVSREGGTYRSREGQAHPDDPGQQRRSNREQLRLRSQGSAELRSRSEREGLRQSHTEWRSSNRRLEEWTAEDTELQQTGEGEQRPVRRTRSARTEQQRREAAYANNMGEDGGLRRARGRHETKPHQERIDGGRGVSAQVQGEEEGGRSSVHGTNRGHRRKRKKPVFWILAAILVVICGITAYSFIKPFLGGRYWTVAVFGVDSRDGNLEAGALSDVEMVCSIDRRTGDIKIVSVYRDTYLKINSDGDYHKINEAYFKGGHRQAVEALEENLDLKIDDYATFNWSAVAKAINELGGIDLEISDAEFSYINAFITETVNSTGIGSVQLQQAGMNHLDGVQAVAYGRLRLMDTDFNRTARQRKVIQLAMEKAKSADAGMLVRLAQAIIPEVSTSIDVTDVVDIAKNIKKYNIAASDGFPFSRQTMKVGKMDCVIPTTLASNVVTLHNVLYGTENFQPSSDVQQISTHIGEVTGLTEAGDNAPAAGTGGGIAHKTPAQQTPETAAPTEAVTEESAEESTEETTEVEETSEEESLPEETVESLPEGVGPGANTQRPTETIGSGSRETTASGEENAGGSTPGRPTQTTEAETTAARPTEAATTAASERPTAPGGDVASDGSDAGPGV